MKEYKANIVAMDSNSVKYTIFRNNTIVFSEDVEPVNIGFIKSIFLLLLFGGPRVQESLFKKAKIRSEQFIKVMKDNEQEN